MADSEFVTARHTQTKLVSRVPRSYVESVYPELYEELSEAEMIEVRRKEEKALFGEYITPAPAKQSAASKKEGEK